MYRQRTTAILTRELGDEVLVLDTQSDQIHQLNATASLIWRHCAEPSEPLAIAVAVTERFDVTLELAEKDVERILQRLQQLDLIVEEPAAERDDAANTST